MDNPSDRHNAAILPALRLIVEGVGGESDQWVLIETLCLVIGKLHGRTPTETALFVENVAERLVEGART